MTFLSEHFSLWILSALFEITLCTFNPFKSGQKEGDLLVWSVGTLLTLDTFLAFESTESAKSDMCIFPDVRNLQMQDPHVIVVVITRGHRTRAGSRVGSIKGRVRVQKFWPSYNPYPSAGLGGVSGFIQGVIPNVCFKYFNVRTTTWCAIDFSWNPQRPATFRCHFGTLSPCVTRSLLTYYDERQPPHHTPTPGRLNELSKHDHHHQGRRQRLPKRTGEMWRTRAGARDASPRYVCFFFFVSFVFLLFTNYTF